MSQRFLQVVRQGCRANQCIFKGHQFAGTHLFEGYARGDAFYIAGAFQLFSKARPNGHTALRCCAVVIQLINGGQALHRDLSISGRVQQPLFELTAAHARHAGVEQREEGGRVFTAQSLCEF